MSDDLIQNMRDRIAKCRRLAATVMDERANKALLEMAAEIEHDMMRLEAGGDPRNLEDRITVQRLPDPPQK